MKVTLNSITGFEDAFATMYISKRTWTPELDKHIREVVRECLDSNGKPYGCCSEETYEEFSKMLSMLIKIGKKHITLLRYIDVSFTVEGIHRGAQDDFDAHARRLDNRIIRSSTRLATYGNEMSEWYDDKIIPTDMALDGLGIHLPEKIYVGKNRVAYEEYELKLINEPYQTYVKAVNGYIREDLKDNKDVKRGLYMLSIPSNFITKCNITEFSHIYKERNENGGANPELKICVESMMHQINEWFPQISKELMLEILN